MNDINRLLESERILNNVLLSFRCMAIDAWDEGNDEFAEDVDEIGDLLSDTITLIGNLLDEQIGR